MIDLANQLIQDKSARIHFVGIGGLGLSALADFRVLSGGTVSGSDRSFDNGLAVVQRDGFVSRGITIYPQDGSGIPGAAGLVISVAIETNLPSDILHSLWSDEGRRFLCSKPDLMDVLHANAPDVAAAVMRNVPIIRRTEWIAAYTHMYPTIAITGTAGKSTTTAMVFEILRACGCNPSLITGADLRILLEDGKPGSAYVGTGPLVIEADESDRGIMTYAPESTVILNLGHDHDSPERILEIYVALARSSTKGIVISHDLALASLTDQGVPVQKFSAQDIQTYSDHVTFKYEGHLVKLQVPGAHNAQNGAAAMALGSLYGCNISDMINALSKFQGVARRFEVVGSSTAVDVVDDYAQNTLKIEAAIKTAQDRRRRVIVYMQPVGFGPMRLMRTDLCPMIAKILRPQDQFFMAPIPYFGGTVVKDISSDLLVDDIRAAGPAGRVDLMENREAFILWAQQQTYQDDVILVMGARDPTLPAFARDIARAVIVN
jgi:UDP-N-acetylmuramate-alanine ligase